MPDILTFENAYGKALGLSKDAKKRIHILLGNGFSIAAHPKFQYDSLYEEAKSLFSGRINALFKQFGTTNFEDILRLLDQGQWLLNHYDSHSSAAQKAMKTDYEIIKDALIDTIGRIHPRSRGSHLSDEMLYSAVRFLENFDTIFTISYDLILYWAMMQSSNENTNKFQDGFRRSSADTNGDVVFTGDKVCTRKFAYCLHGGLHLRTEDGLVKKTTWDPDQAIIEKVRIGIENGQYPLIVSEGKYTDKLQAIRSSYYLSSAFREFERIEGCLFTFGTDLSLQDQHLQDAIVRNKKINLVCLGIYGDEHSCANQELFRRICNLRDRRDAELNNGTKSYGSWSRLNVLFYRSESANVWPPNPETERHHIRKI